MFIRASLAYKMQKTNYILSCSSYKLAQSGEEPKAKVCQINTQHTTSKPIPPLLGNSDGGFEHGGVPAFYLPG